MVYKDEHGRLSKIRRPDWANDPSLALSSEAVENFANSGLGVPPRMIWQGSLKADVVLRGDGDIIYHFHEIKYQDFRKLLAEVVESHFGSTDAFKLDEVYEIPGTWGLLAKGVRTNPLFNFDFYTTEFLGLLESTLEELKG
jgi:hypothetical protein